MSHVRVELNSKGIQEMLKGEDMQALLKEKATEIADRAGNGYEVNVFVGKTRANASVSTKTKKAMRDNLQNNTLLKAVK